MRGRFLELRSHEWSNKSALCLLAAARCNALGQPSKKYSVKYTLYLLELNS